MNTISLHEAMAAHQGTSWVPEKRAQQEIESHAAELAQDRAALEKHATTPEKLATLDAEWARYAAGYTERKRRYLASRARVISWFIAGPSKFPAARMNKRADVSHRRLEDLISFRERALQAIIRTLHPEWRPIMAGDADAEARLVEKIAKAEALQERMKAANAAIRKHAKAGAEAQTRALVEQGLSPTHAAELLKPDYCGRIGFPDYETRNNGANIRRMRERLEQVRRTHAQPVTEKAGANARLEDDPPANRVRLFFPGKPAADVRERLKRGGFCWTPSIGCWQAYRNTWSLDLAKREAGFEQTLAERLSDQTKVPLAPEFVAWLRAVANLNGKSEDEAYAMWREHVRKNEASDQSATKFEFCQWNGLKDPEAVS